MDHIIKYIDGTFIAAMRHQLRHENNRTHKLMQMDSKWIQMTHCRPGMIVMMRLSWQSSELNHHRISTGWLRSRTECSRLQCLHSCFGKVFKCAFITLLNLDLKIIALLPKSPCSFRRAHGKLSKICIFVSYIMSQANQIIPKLDQEDD